MDLRNILEQASIKKSDSYESHLHFQIPDFVQAIIVAVMMAILTPIMAELGKYVEQVNMAKRIKAQQKEDAEVEEKTK